VGSVWRVLRSDLRRVARPSGTTKRTRLLSSRSAVTTSDSSPERLCVGRCAKLCVWRATLRPELRTGARDGPSSSVRPQSSALSLQPLGCVQQSLGGAKYASVRLGRKWHTIGKLDQKWAADTCAPSHTLTEARNTGPFVGPELGAFEQCSVDLQLLLACNCCRRPHASSEHCKHRS